VLQYSMPDPARTSDLAVPRWPLEAKFRNCLGGRRSIAAEFRERGTRERFQPGVRAPGKALTHCASAESVKESSAATRVEEPLICLSRPFRALLFLLGNFPGACTRLKSFNPSGLNAISEIRRK
jgi:hypothetical protein